MTISKITLSFLILGFLVACGGGAKSTAQSSSEESIIDRSLNYSVYRSDMTTGEATAVINYDAATQDGSIVFAAPNLRISTTDGYENVTWTSPRGFFESEGKLLMSCVGAGVGGATIFLASDSVRVINLSELKGKSFSERTCNTDPNYLNAEYKFNNDGTMSIIDEANKIIDAGKVSQLFSDSGVTEAAEGIFKAQAWKVVVNNTTKFIIIFINDNSSGEDSVAYGLQSN